MAEKRVSVRLAAVGGRQVRAELEGVGEAGARGFGRLSREMEAARPARGLRAAASGSGVCVSSSGPKQPAASGMLRPLLGRAFRQYQQKERGEISPAGEQGKTLDFPSANLRNRDPFAGAFRWQATLSGSWPHVASPERRWQRCDRHFGGLAGRGGLPCPRSFGRSHLRLWQ